MPQLIRLCNWLDCFIDWLIDWLTQAAVHSTCCRPSFRDLATCTAQKYSCKTINIYIVYIEFFQLVFLFLYCCFLARATATWGGICYSQLVALYFASRRAACSFSHPTLHSSLPASPCLLLLSRETRPANVERELHIKCNLQNVFFNVCNCEI